MKRLDVSAVGCAEKGELVELLFLKLQEREGQYPDGRNADPIVWPCKLCGTWCSTRVLYCYGCKASRSPAADAICRAMTLSEGEKLIGCDISPSELIKVLSVDRSLDPTSFRGNFQEGLIISFTMLLRCPCDLSRTTLDEINLKYVESAALNICSLVSRRISLAPPSMLNFQPTHTDTELLCRARGN